MAFQVFINSIRFVSLVLFQALILSNVNLGFYINPYVYPLFILLLPRQLPSWAVQIISFLTGLVIDSFLNTSGFHAAACVLIGFLRPYIFILLTPRNGYESEDQPNIKYLGISWFATYTMLMILIHHLVYFFIEVYAIAEIGRTLLRILLSTVISVLLIMLIEFIVSPQPKRRYEFN
jgi:hypothetical protein